MATLNADYALQIQYAVVAALDDPTTRLKSANAGAEVDVSGFDKTFEHYLKRVDFMASAGLSKGAIVWMQYKPEKPTHSGAGVIFTNNMFADFWMGCPILTQNWPVDETEFLRLDAFRIKFKEVIFSNRTMGDKSWFTNIWDVGYDVRKTQPNLYVFKFRALFHYTSYYS